MKILRILTIALASMGSMAAGAQSCESGAAGPTRPLLIRHVHVLTMAPDRPPVLPEIQSVLIERGAIVRIAPASDLQPPLGAVVVDGRGKYLLPGLIDAHVHIWDTPELSAYLASGVTTVRNASGMPFHLEYGRSIEAGCLEGPRLITTGPILNGDGPNKQPNHQIVNTAQEAAAAVQAQYAQGYRHLKVYSNLSKQSYSAIVKEGRRLGMTIMGHTPEGVREAGIPHLKPFQIAFEDLLPDGFVSIEHMESIVWHGLSDRLDERKARALAREIARHRVAVTPTLVAHHNLVLVARSRGQYLKRRDVEWLNPFITELEQGAYAQWSTAAPDGRTQFDAFYLRATKIFQEEGVTLLAGTDAGVFTNVPGRSLVDELQLLASAGLTPVEALETATRSAAGALGLGGQIGQVKVGHLADLILVDGDPSHDLTNLSQISGLVVAGKWYDEGELARLKRQAAATSYDRSRAQILRGLAAQGSMLQ